MNKLSEFALVEHKPAKAYQEFYGQKRQPDGSGVPWCAYFVAYCLEKSGTFVPKKPFYGNVTDLVDQLKRAGWRKSLTPETGSVWHREGEHVGIVAQGPKNPGNSFTSVEGNTSAGDNWLSEFPLVRFVHQQATHTYLLPPEDTEATLWDESPGKEDEMNRLIQTCYGFYRRDSANNLVWVGKTPGNEAFKIVGAGWGGYARVIGVGTKVPMLLAIRPDGSAETWVLDQSTKKPFNKRPAGTGWNKFDSIQPIIGSDDWLAVEKTAGVLNRYWVEGPNRVVKQIKISKGW